jgi:tRNA A-37 threonylcarbamoyl transferase component Bud32
MKKLFFADSWQNILADNGFKTFDDIFHQDNKVEINRNNKRNVSIVYLKTESGDKKFFLKRFRHSHIKDAIFVFMNTGKIQSQAAYEWGNIKRLEENNIKAPPQICFGEQFRLGVERRSFIITKEIEDQCLTDFIAQNWAALPQSEKEKIVIAIGKEIRKIHDARFSLPDLYVWHIFIGKENNNGSSNYRFTFIDLNRMKRNFWNPGEKVENLGRLHHSMSAKYFDEPMRNLLIKSYASEKNDDQIKKLIARVEKYSKKFSARRRLKQY